MDDHLTDPLGRRLTLHERTWHGHILRGHPDMAPHFELVRAAIRDPIEIRRSVADPCCRLFFGTGPRASVMILAVADVELGLVKTAHLARRISGGDTEWSRPTR